MVRCISNLREFKIERKENTHFTFVSMITVLETSKNHRFSFESTALPLLGVMACLYAEMTRDKLMMVNLYCQLDWILDLAKRHISSCVYKDISQEIQQKREVLL